MADSLCPGRHLAQRGLPDVKGEWAESGSRIHADLADCPREGIQILPSLKLEEREMFDSCREIEKKKVAEFFGAEHPPMKVIRERPDGSTRLWGKFPQNGGTFLEHSAQLDVVFRAGTRALICEYKTLIGDVPESSRNLQLRDQAVLFRGNTPLIEEIGTVVIQPLVTHDPEICLYTRPDIDRAERDMWARIAQSNDPSSLRVSGEEQCKWCLAKSRCVGHNRWAGSMLPITNQDLFTVAMADWSPAQRALAAAALSPARKMLDQIAEFLKAGCEADPAFIPGWTLKPGNKCETITNPQTCFERFIALGGTSKKFMEIIIVTKGKLREIVSDLTGARGKALDSAIATLTEGIVEVKQDAPSLKKVEET